MPAALLSVQFRRPVTNFFEVPLYVRRRLESDGMRTPPRDRKMASL